MAMLKWGSALLGLAIGGFVQAAEDTSGAEDVFNESLRSLIFGLLILIVMIYVAYYIMRRAMGMPATSGRQVRVTEITGVSNRERVVIVQADGRRFMLGVAQGGVSLLTELDAVAPTPESDAKPKSSPFEKALAFAKGEHRNKDD